MYPKKELRVLSPNFHIHVSVSNLYIPRIGLHIFLQQNKQTVRGNIKIAHRHMNVEIGTEDAQFIFWEYLFQILVLCFCSARTYICSTRKWTSCLCCPFFIFGRKLHAQEVMKDSWPSKVKKHYLLYYY